MSKYRTYEKLWESGWLAGELEKKSMHLIAQEQGCSYGAIHNAMKKLGLKGQPDGVLRRKTPDWGERVSAGIRAKHPHGRFGEEASNWRGGRTKSAKGYIFISAPNHPSAVCGKVFEHRLVMEKKLGRYLEKNEVVHHINGDRKDNRPENLELFKRGQHTVNHFQEGFDVMSLRAEVSSLKEANEALRVENESLRVENEFLKVRLGGISDEVVISYS